MRVLFIVNNFPAPSSPVDGIFNLRAVQAVRARGHEVRVIRVAPHVPPWLTSWQRYRTLPAHYDVDGISVRVVRGLMGPKRWAIGTLSLQAGRTIKNEIAAFAADVVHVHGLLPAGVLGLACASPLVLTAHGSEAYALPWRRPGLQRLARRVLRRAQTVAAVSGFVADHLRRLGRDDVTIVYNGADEATFAPRSRDACRQALNIALHRNVVAFAGHVMEEKGVFDLVAALAAVRELDPLLVIAGPSTSENAARMFEKASEGGLDLRFLGSLEQADLANVLAACDVFVLPSHAEGLPTVICEAMMMGRAVVATRVGGIPEIVRHRETGFVVPPRHPQELAGALRRLLLEPEMRLRCEARASAFAAEHLSWRQNAARYESLYGKAIAAVCAGSDAGGAAPPVATVPPSSTP